MTPAEIRRRPTAVVTGASSGFGREFARLCAADGYDLVVVARRRHLLEALEAELESAHDVKVRVIARDLSDPAAPRLIYDEIAAAGMPVEVLINNAGFGGYGLFHERDLQSHMEMIHVDLSAVTELSRYFLPDMVARGRGYVLNVASTAAFQPGPLQAVYYAAKAYVLSLSEAVAEELRGSGVRVSVLCPGPAATGFGERAGVTRSDAFRKLRSDDPDAIARAGYEGMRAGKRVIVPGFMNRLGVFAVRLMPRRAVTRLVARLQRVPAADSAGGQEDA